MTAHGAAPEAAPGRPPAPLELESLIGRLLFVGALVGVALLVVGVGLMVAGGIDPTSGTAAGFDPARVVPDLLAARPEGFLWAGIVVLIGTPIARVLGELLVFARRRDRLMTAVAATILGIIAVSIVLGTFAEA